MTQIVLTLYSLRYFHRCYKWGGGQQENAIKNSTLFHKGEKICLIKDSTADVKFMVQGKPLDLFLFMGYKTLLWMQIIILLLGISEQLHH